ncbi:MAG: hypothetical protein WKG07_38835 [Hymenobacter sp.]
MFEGTVKFDGIDASFDGAGLVSDIFERMVRHQAYDVSELGLSFYLRTLDLDNPPFIAIPVFPNRFFRHSAIFVNKASGIEKPADLAGKTIGEFGMYGHDAGIWPKGILADDFGVTPRAVPLGYRGHRLVHAALRFHPAAASGQRRGVARAGGQNLGRHARSGRD